MSLYFVCNYDKIVFSFSPAEDGYWRFSRLSLFQQKKGLEKFVLLYRSSEQTESWVVVDQTSSAKGEVIGQPSKELQESQHPEGPPLGNWHVWGSPFVLTDTPPRHPPLELDPPFPLEVPFATVRYSEEGSVARLEVTMHSTPIVDDILEQVLSRLSGVLRSLAQRPEMVLFIRSDARNAAVPAVRHVKRFLGFVQENGSEFVLVGRGHAMVLSSKGILGNTLLATLRLVQRLFPAPWPENTVSTMQAADAFLADLARTELATQALQAPMRSRSPSKEIHGTVTATSSPMAVDGSGAEGKVRPPEDGDPASDVAADGEPRHGEQLTQEFGKFEPILDLGLTMPEAPSDDLERAGDDIDTTVAVGSPSSWPWLCSSCSPSKSGQKAPHR